MDVIAYEPHGAESPRHLGRLDARAARRPEAPVLPIPGNWYGMTLPTYDARANACTFSGAIRRPRFTIGRSAARGKDIV